jgi:WhiB family redox-sensing transcriptional regulator
MSTAWLQHAACSNAGIDPEMFFPERGDVATAKAATTFCHGCPVERACLEANLHEKQGVWGGMSEADRRKERRRRRRLKWEARP